VPLHHVAQILAAEEERHEDGHLRRAKKVRGAAKTVE